MHHNRRFASCPVPAVWLSARKKIVAAVCRHLTAPAHIHRVHQPVTRCEPGIGHIQLASQTHVFFSCAKWNRRAHLPGDPWVPRAQCPVICRRHGDDPVDGAHREGLEEAVHPPGQTVLRRARLRMAIEILVHPRILHVDDERHSGLRFPDASERHRGKYRRGEIHKVDRVRPNQTQAGPVEVPKRPQRDVAHACQARHRTRQRAYAQHRHRLGNRSQQVFFDDPPLRSADSEHHRRPPVRRVLRQTHPNAVHVR